MTAPRNPTVKPERRLSSPRRTTKSIAETLKHMTPEWTDRLIAYSANQGDFSLLTEALSAGDELGPLTREFLVEDFVSGKPRKRGNKKTFAQISSDVELLFKVVCVMIEHQIALPAAITLVAKNENMARTSLTSVVARTRPSLSEMMPSLVNGRWIGPWDSSL
jgi:hypothetical protein